MKPAKPSLLLHPLFLSSLFVLLANDFFWKYSYHNWLTGKLSDVAGLIVLPVFCRVLFPKLSKPLLLLACAAFFAWWKSPWSQPVISAVNETLQLPVHRVIDSSDLLALVVLPLGLSIRPKALQVHRLAFQGLRWTLGLLTFVSLCSTSVYQPLFQAHPDSREYYFHKSWTQKRTAADILQTLQAKGISYRLDSVMYYPVLNQQQLYYRNEKADDSLSAWQQISQAPDSALYLKREGSPYYLVPAYLTTFGGREVAFRNIRFTLAENKKRKKTVITIEMFEAPGLRPYVYIDRKTRRAYQQVFESLFAAQ